MPSGPPSIGGGGTCVVERTTHRMCIAHLLAGLLHGLPSGLVLLGGVHVQWLGLVLLGLVLLELCLVDLHWLLLLGPQRMPCYYCWLVAGWFSNY